MLLPPNRPSTSGRQRRLWKETAAQRHMERDALRSFPVGENDDDSSPCGAIRCRLLGKHCHCLDEQKICYLMEAYGRKPFYLFKCVRHLSSHREKSIIHASLKADLQRHMGCWWGGGGGTSLHCCTFAPLCNQRSLSRA